jgi:mRNA degradation ribonuclease J1/J2
MEVNQACGVHARVIFPTAPGTNVTAFIFAVFDVLSSKKYGAGNSRHKTTLASGAAAASNAESMILQQKPEYFLRSLLPATLFSGLL